MKKENSFWTFLEAWFQVHWARLLIVFTSFQNIAGKLGRPQVDTEWIDVDSALADHLKTAIRRAAKYSLHNINCYDQALAGMIMCKRRRLSATIYFGLAKDAGGLNAHAWLRCGNCIITGGALKSKYTQVAWFGYDFNPVHLS